MYAGELCHGVIAVLGEHATEEVRRAGLARVRREGWGHAGVAGVQELIEQQTAQALGASAVSGEQRSGCDLGQVGEHENRRVDVAHVASQHGSLVCGEGL